MSWDAMIAHELAKRPWCQVLHKRQLEHTVAMIEAVEEADDDD